MKIKSLIFGLVWGSLLPSALSSGPSRAQSPNTPVLPAQAAFYDLSGSGSTLLVEVRSATGTPLPFKDGGGGHNYGAVSLAIPASTAEGIGYLITQTKPDSTDSLAALSNQQYTLIVQVATGKVVYTPSGTSDSTLGSGNGIAIGLPAPGALNPVVLAAGNTYQITNGVVTPNGTPVSQTVGAGSLLAAPPASWATGTDWAAGSTPALSPVIKAIWINILPGTTCSIKVDAGGATGFVFGNVQAGWFQLPPGLSVTKIYAPANGSTGAVISGVLY